MSTPRSTALTRRLLLFGVPAAVVTAATLVARPAHASSAKAKVYECAADLLQES